MADIPAQEPITSVNTRPEGLLYEERRSAQRWPLVVPAAVGSLLLVGVPVVALATLNAVVAFEMVPVFALWLIVGGKQYLLHRHTGIQFTTRRIAIGAVDLMDKRPDPLRPKFKLASLGSAAYTCAWEDVLSLRIETDRKVIKNIRLDPGNLGNSQSTALSPRVTRRLGFVVPPYAKAVLLIHVRVESAHFPELVAGRRLANIESPIWAVPTRRPKELAKALASFPPAARFDPTAPLAWYWST